MRRHPVPSHTPGLGACVGQGLPYQHQTPVGATGRSRAGAQRAPARPHWGTQPPYGSSRSGCLGGNRERAPPRAPSHPVLGHDIPARGGPPQPVSTRPEGPGGSDIHPAWTADPPSTCCLRERSWAPTSVGSRVHVRVCTFHPHVSLCPAGWHLRHKPQLGAPEPLATPRAAGRGVLGRRRPWPRTEARQGSGRHQSGTSM